MTDESELDYLQRRAAEELDYADVAADPIAAEIHRRMGLLYAKKVAELGHQQHLEIVPPSAAVA